MEKGLGMNMKKFFVLATASFGAFALNAGVSNVVVTQPSASEVVVTYDLTGDPAIVTVDITTNGVSVGASHLRSISGAVNRLVQPGTGLVARWKAYVDMCDVESASVNAEVTAWSPSTPPDYMVVDLRDSESKLAHEYYADIEAIPLGFTNALYKTAKMIFRRVPAAGTTFLMGSRDGEPDRNDDREIPHLVSFTNDFWLGIYTMTIGQYNTLVNGMVTTIANPYCPKILRSWADVRNAVPADPPAPSSPLGKFKDRTGLSADLPTDAEFEFAHRAGVSGPIVNPDYTYANTGADPLKIDWCQYGSNSSLDGFQDVGMLEPNRWHFYDMGGNSANYCRDYYTYGGYYKGTFPANYETGIPAVAPLVSIKNDKIGDYHIARGGRWNMTNASNTRPAHRYLAEFIADYMSLRISVPIYR